MDVMETKEICKGSDNVENNRKWCWVDGDGRKRVESTG